MVGIDGPAGASQETLLDIANLRAGYGRIAALKGVSLAVRSGEIVTLIGANGAGKSTLLKTIAGLMRPWTGGVTFAGKLAGQSPTVERVQRGLVLVPEGRRILIRMSVYENLLMGAYTRSDSAVRDDVENVFRRFPSLERRRTAMAGVLSGGEQQMLAIGRALMAKPRLLMLDEPSLGLAPLVVKEIFALVAELRNSGITILLVEQNARQALQCADRGYVLETGEIRVQGTADELLASPDVQSAYLGGSSSKGR